LKVFDSSYEVNFAKFWNLFIIGCDIFIPIEARNNTGNVNIFLLHSKNADEWALYPINRNDTYHSYAPIITANKQGSVLLLCGGLSSNWDLFACYKDYFFIFEETKGTIGYTYLITLLAIISFVPIVTHYFSRKHKS